MSRRARSPAAQIQMILNTHGGARPGAGRPNLEDEGAHEARPLLTGKHPLHVTLTLKRKFPGLRNKKLFHFFSRAVRRARQKGLRVVEFQLRAHELHLIVEAPHTSRLSVGMQSFGTSLAKSLRNLVGPERIPEHKKKFLKAHERKKIGSVFEHRFALKVLSTPGQVKAAMTHIAGVGRGFHVPDPYRSRMVWRAPEAAEEKSYWVMFLKELLAPPETWLLRSGWRLLS